MYYIVTDNTALQQFNEIFKLPKIGEPYEGEMPEKAETLIHINKGVFCNALAYKDAFKQSSCQTFHTYINKGIFGTEDLAERCVRSQKDTQHLRPLSPIKKEVVDAEFYRFLLLKRKSVSDIEKELEKSNMYHHRSISSAKLALKRQKRREEAKRSLEETEEEKAIEEKEIIIHFHNLNVCFKF